MACLLSAALHLSRSFSLASKLASAFSAMLRAIVTPFARRAVASRSFASVPAAIKVNWCVRPLCALLRASVGMVVLLVLLASRNAENWPACIVVQCRHLKQPRG